MKIDQTSAWNAWKMGAKEYENGNGEATELLIDATDYLDRNPDSEILSDFAEETGIDKSVEKEYTKEQRDADIQAFVNGEKTFEEALEAYAYLYADLVNSNKIWSWDEDVEGEQQLSRRMKRDIKKQAIKSNLIIGVPIRAIKDGKYKIADFSTAKLVVKEISLPEDMWLLSDKKQFEWLNEQIGGKVPGYTWHHSETPGVMQLVPTGIHRVTPHAGGRSPGMWAYRGKR